MNKSDRKWTGINTRRVLRRKRGQNKKPGFQSHQFWVLHICLCCYCCLSVMLLHCLHVMFVNYMPKVLYNCHVCNCCLVDHKSCKICGQPLNQILRNLVSVFHYFLVQKLTPHRCWGLNSSYLPGCFKFRLFLIQSQSCIALRLVSYEDLIEGLKEDFHTSSISLFLQKYYF